MCNNNEEKQQKCSANSHGIELLVAVVPSLPLQLMKDNMDKASLTAFTFYTTLALICFFFAWVLSDIHISTKEKSIILPSQPQTATKEEKRKEKIWKILEDEHFWEFQGRFFFFMTLFILVFGTMPYSSYIATVITIVMVVAFSAYNIYMEKDWIRQFIKFIAIFVALGVFVLAFIIGIVKSAV